MAKPRRDRKRTFVVELQDGRRVTVAGTHISSMAVIALVWIYDGPRLIAEFRGAKQIYPEASHVESLQDIVRMPVGGSVQ